MNTSINALNETVNFYTDAATLAIFDTAVLEKRCNEPIDWWATSDFSKLPEIAAGLITLISLGGDGFYSVRITNGTLTDDEKHAAREVTGPLGIVSKSGSIFIGNGESLPGDGARATGQAAGVEENGSFITLAPGNYDLMAYSIEPFDDTKKKFPDVVVTITPRIGVFAGVNSEPRLNYDLTKFLFPSAKNTKRKTPKLNITLKAKVIKTSRLASGLALKDMRAAGEDWWPKRYEGYEVQLEDMKLVTWSDIILVKTKRIDEENKVIYAELIEKLGKTPNN